MSLNVENLMGLDRMDTMLTRRPHRDTERDDFISRRLSDLRQSRAVVTRALIDAMHGREREAIVSAFMGGDDLHFAELIRQSVKRQTMEAAEDEWDERIDAMRNPVSKDEE